jgi:hypothetical protein
MRRIERLAVKYAKGLAEAVEREPPTENAEERVSRIAAALPDGKDAGKWLEALTKWHVAGKLPLDGVQDAARDLSVLSIVKARLPVEKRNPLAASGPAIVAQTIAPFRLDRSNGIPLTGKEADRTLAKRMREPDQADILHDDENGLVLIPKTAESAAFRGRGTRWCTATLAIGDNAFDGYNALGPILVILLRDGRKFQLQAAIETIVDERDRRIDVGKLLRIAPWLADSPRAAAHLHPFLAKTQGKSKLAEAIVQNCDHDELCRANPRLAPKLERATRAGIIDAVANFPEIIGELPEEFRIDETIITAAVARRPHDAISILNGLGIIPTDEILMNAVKKEPTVIIVIPEERRSRDLLLAVADAGHEVVLRFSGNDEEIFTRLVTANPLALASIPEERRLAGVRRIALSKNGTLLYLVPDEIMTENDVLAALDAENAGPMTRRDAIRLIPERFLSIPEIRRAILAIDGRQAERKEIAKNISETERILALSSILANLVSDDAELTARLSIPAERDAILAEDPELPGRKIEEAIGRRLIKIFLIPEVLLSEAMVLAALIDDPSRIHEIPVNKLAILARLSDDVLEAIPQKGRGKTQAAFVLAEAVRAEPRFLAKVPERIRKDKFFLHQAGQAGKNQRSKQGKGGGG